MSITWHGVTLIFEFGWTSNPSTAIGSTTWTDESVYVRDVTSSRGRNTENGTFDAGRLSITLDNRTRRFDPNYAAGALFGNLLPMRRVRVRATFNAITYPIWHGFVDDLPQAYDISNKDATVTIQCTDGFAVMALSKLAESVHYYTVTDLAPIGWYRLGEQFGTEVYDSTGNGRNGTYGGGATFNSGTGLIVGSADGAINFDGVDDVAFIPTPATLAFPVTIEAWIQTTTVLSSIYLNILVGDRECFFESRTDGKLRANVVTNGYSGGLFFTSSDGVVNDGAPHHIVAVYTNSASSPTLYVDGVVNSATTGSLTVTGNANTVSVIGGDVSNKIVATIDEVAIYDYALAAGDVTDLYEGGSIPWQGDTTGARIGRYLDRVSWPAADRDIATGVSTLQLVELGNDDVLSLARNVEASEQGQLYMSADGKVTFRDRHFRFEDTGSITSQATFADDGAGVGLPYRDVVTDGGAQFIFNRIVASRKGGAEVVVSDATSITKFYERTDTVTGLENESQAEVVDLANWRLATHKNPAQRVTVLEIRARRDPTNLFPQVLGLDIGDRVTVQRTPQGLGAALSYTPLIEGVNHSVDIAGDWVTTFYLSSVDSQISVQPLVLDSATYGLLDTNVLGY